MALSISQGLIPHNQTAERGEGETMMKKATHFPKENGGCIGHLKRFFGVVMNKNMGVQAVILSATKRELGRGINPR